MHFNSKRLAHIDSLRSIAVLSVFLYHLNFLNGGYFGVDIFLVISGYVIAKILIDEKDISINFLLNFILKRVERLLPAVLVIILFTSFIGYFYLLPGELVFLKNTINYSSLFLSNIFFFFNTNYFSEVSNSPLLHLWSIGLEFQFYLFISLFFYFFKTNLKLILLIFLISILLAQIGGNLKYNYPFIENEFSFFNPIFGSFYLLPTRLFEFCFGMILVILKKEIFSLKKKKIYDSLDYLSFIGLISFFIFGIKDLPHPSIVTLILCFFTANLIIDNKSNNVVRIILKNKNISKFGLISYGFYLWHYVIIYFFNLEKIKELNFANSILIFLLTFALSFISYSVIEKPLRLKTNKIFKIFFYSFFIIFLIIINNKNFIKIKQTQRFDSNILKEYENFNNYEKKYSNCRGKSIKNACIYGNKNNLNTVLWGDSHLNQLAPVINKIANEKNLGFKELSVPGCLPIINTSRNDKQGWNCSIHNDKIFNYILEDNGIKNIIFHAYWNFYVDKKGVNSSVDASVDEIIINQFKRLSEKNKKIFIILGVPNYSRNPKKYIFRKKLFNKEIKSIKNITYINLKYHFDKNKENQKIFNNLKLDNLYIYDPASNLCDEIKCYSILKNRPIYRDGTHISKKESFLLYNDLNQFLDIELLKN
ncbi:acyltransferase [Pelagibacterales bacterium SAG-MED08]|nr:acyltransferase [Pelagibacterales bacterium SAG-MED08]